MGIGVGRAVDMGFETAIDKFTDEMQRDCFGILSNIDVAVKMKEKLDREIPCYPILGAVNPPLAWEAIHAIE